MTRQVSFWTGYFTPKYVFSGNLSAKKVTLRETENC